MTNGWPIARFDEREYGGWSQAQLAHLRYMDNAVRRTRGQLRTSAPNDPQEGEIYYTDGTTWDPIGEGAGYYGYLNGQYILLSASQAIQGYYDQRNDIRIPQGGNLDAASNYNLGDYYVITESGAFITPIPELNGLNAVPGEQIASDGTQWVLLTGTGDFLSKRLDDTAQGVITFAVGAKSTPASPVDADDLTRKDYVDDKDNQNQVQLDAHISQTAQANDVHGTKTYTDAHAALLTASDNAHGSKDYVDAHTSQSDIHFTDAPNDGELYGRGNLDWYKIPSVDTCNMYGAPPSFSVGTGGTVITNYPEAYDIGGDFDGLYSPAAGTISVPIDGLYEVSGHILGTQGNSNKEESFFLDVRITGGLDPGDYPVAAFQVATDKTPRSRQLSFALTRALFLGETLSLVLSATTDMGTFTFTLADFKITQIIEGFTPPL